MAVEGDNQEHMRIVVRIDADLEDMIPGYLANRRQDVENILQSMAKHDYEAIKNCGHSMKGSGGGYGFDAITEYGAEIERGAKEQDQLRIRRAVDQLTYFIDHVVVQYEEVE